MPGIGKNVVYSALALWEAAEKHGLLYAAQLSTRMGRIISTELSHSGQPMYVVKWRSRQKVKMTSLFANELEIRN